jgi:tetratricopeptide (TPR) repeat protein
MKRTMIGRCCSTLIVLALIATAGPALGQALTIDSEQQYGYAQQLFDNGQYRNAAEEYQRFAYFFPRDARQRQALFKAGQALLMAKDLAAALDRFKELAATEPLDSIAIESYFMMVECHLHMQASTQAMVDLNNLITISDDADVRDRAYYRMGWLSIGQTDWYSAQQAFSRISAARRSRYRIDDLDRELSAATQLPTRNPTLAGTLSIVPGGGQLYCNRYEDALIAFAVNLGLFWAAHDAFDQEQYALGSLISFVGLGFYTGNIYSAVSDAHKYNRLQRQKFGSNLQRYLVIGVAPSGPPASANVFFGLRVPF